MAILHEHPIRIQEISGNWYQHRVAQVAVLRLDLLHPIISGNKWYKLHYNLEAAKAKGCTTLLTFGGGYSNHLAATACVARLSGLRTVAVVRGNYKVLTPCLQACSEDGMQLHPVTREAFDARAATDWCNVLNLKPDDTYIVPMGGDNELGRAGAGLIARFCPPTFTHIAVSVGSGTTYAGLRLQLPAHQYVLGFAPMKQGSYLNAALEPILEGHTNRRIIDDYHLGGFGKAGDDLIHFMNTLYLDEQLPTDRVYTAKMMYGIRDMLQKGTFSPTDRILCIHTGGLQGNLSISHKLVYT